MSLFNISPPQDILKKYEFIAKSIFTLDLYIKSSFWANLGLTNFFWSGVASWPYMHVRWIWSQKLRDEWEKKVLKFQHEIPIGRGAWRKKWPGGAKKALPHGSRIKKTCWHKIPQLDINKIPQTVFLCPIQCQFVKITREIQSITCRKAVCRILLKSCVILWDMFS